MNLRKATRADELFMFVYKNYPETRQYALETMDGIDSLVHAAFWDAHWPEFQMIFLDDPSEPVGAVRIKSDGEIAIWIDRAHWGRGIATFILDKVAEPGKSWARIGAFNIPSMRAFIKAGFAPTCFVSAENYYTFKI